MFRSESAEYAFSEYSRDGNLTFSVLHHPKFRNMINIAQESVLSFYAKGTALDHASEAVLNELSKCRSSGYCSESSPPRYIVSMKEIFDKQFNKSLTLDDVSGELHINKYKLAKEFKQYYRISPIEYLIERRIESAKVLLTTTGKTVTCIGTETAIENTPYFVRLFKKHTGMTPLKYRNCHAFRLPIQNSSKNQ
jgi:YesN/AraC family two-component response regulator